MGIPGLTKFIDSNRDTFFVDRKLENCTVVFDGNGLAAILYSWKLQRYGAFGGDYDRYGNLLEKFIKLLRKCNIKPVFVFDGGVESKKLKTVVKRSKLKVLGLEKVFPGHVNRLCFPLLMRQATKQKLKELNVQVLQSDLEADEEIAALANSLNAPIISNDSDFYVFDVKYIPLSLFDYESAMINCPKNKNSFYINCKIFRPERLFTAFKGLDRSKLPLLATIIGNDYVQWLQFSSIFNYIKLDRNSKSSGNQKKIKGLLNWLKKESVETAVPKILSSLSQKQRKKFSNTLEMVADGYSPKRSNLVSYLTENMTNDEFVVESSNVKVQNDEEDTDIENIDAYLTEENECSSEEETIESFDNESLDSCIPQWFWDRSRVALMDPAVITLVSLKSFFSNPQSENYNLDAAGLISLPILKTIAGIVLGKDEFKYWYRQKYKLYLAKDHETHVHNLPDLKSVNSLSNNDRQQIVTDALNLAEFNSKLFPEEWELLVIAIAYWIKSCSGIKPYHIHAVFMMLVAVNGLDPSIGFYRDKNRFVKKYGDIAANSQPIKLDVLIKSVKQAKKSILKDDCLLLFDNILPYFCLRDHYSSRSYAESIVHIFAELQSCIEAAMIINSLLLSPFKDIQIFNFYNSTFLYNMALNLQKRNNIVQYLESFLDKTPSLLTLYKSICFALQNILPAQVLKPKKPKSKPKVPISVDCLETDSQQSSSDENDFVDLNNRFSNLTFK